MSGDHSPATERAFEAYFAVSKHLTDSTKPDHLHVAEAMLGLIQFLCVSLEALHKQSPQQASILQLILAVQMRKITDEEASP
jgi:hypothetical protein